MYLEDFNYSLPKNLIAKRPTDKRRSKILICSKKKILSFEKILNELSGEDVLVFNNTKVIPSIIKGVYDNKEIKFTLLQNFQTYCWKVFIKPAKKVKENTVIKFKNDLYCTVINKKSVIAEVKFNHKYETVIAAKLEENTNDDIPVYTVIPYKYD